MSTRTYNRSWTDLSRISSKYKIDENGCWIWQAGMYGCGYGKFSLNGKNTNAHRASFIIHNGSFDFSKMVLHKCDVKKCINPDHLYIGDKSQNAKDAYNRGQLVSWGSKKTHCKNGHEFSLKNTKYTKKKRRRCLECAKIRSKKSNEIAKSRRSHCKYGHLFGPGNNEYKLNGYRKCIVCIKIRSGINET